MILACVDSVAEAIDIRERWEVAGFRIRGASSRTGYVKGFLLVEHILESSIVSESRMIELLCPYFTEPTNESPQLLW